MLQAAPEQHQVQHGDDDSDRIEQVFRVGRIAELAHHLFGRREVHLCEYGHRKLDAEGHLRVYQSFERVRNGDDDDECDDQRDHYAGAYP